MKAKMVDFFNSKSLVSKVLALVFVPSLSFLMVSLYDINRDWSKYRSSKIVERNNKGLVNISALIRELQIERGTSAVFLKSGQMPLESLKAKWDLTDAQLPAVNQFVEVFEGEESSQVSGHLKGLPDLREYVKNGGDVSEALKRYTLTVRSLIKLQRATSIVASSSKISSQIRTLLLFEMARENSGLLRANLSGILVQNKPISDPLLYKIIALKSGIDVNLTSEALEVSPEIAQMISDFSQKNHWIKVEEVFKKVVKKSSEGGFEEDGNQFFATITLLVDDIGTLIGNELEYINRSTQKEISEAFLSLMILCGAIIANSIIIALFLVVAIKLLKSHLSQLIQKITASTEGVQDSSIGLLDTSQKLSSGAQEVAAAIQETVSSMSEMKSMVSRTKDKSQDTKVASEEIGENINKSGHIIDDLKDSMDHLVSSNEELSEVTKVIKSISKQTKVIDDIVFKTQLLSVNASIEAAKAGNHGKGFAVVADEVSKLADMSGAASEKIESLLTESEVKVQQIVKDVNQRVTRGTETARSVSDVFSTISKEIENIKHLSDDMDQACSEQSLGIEQITIAISQIDESTQVNTEEAGLVEQRSNDLKNDSRVLWDASTQMMKSMIGGTLENSQDTRSSRDHNTEPPDHSNSNHSENDQNSSVIDIKTGSLSQDQSLADHDSFRPAS